jgi:hypothetical protein
MSTMIHVQSIYPAAALARGAAWRRSVILFDFFQDELVLVLACSAPFRVIGLHSVFAESEYSIFDRVLDFATICTRFHVSVSHDSHITSSNALEVALLVHT